MINTSSNEQKSLKNMVCLQYLHCFPVKTEYSICIFVSNVGSIAAIQALNHSKLSVLQPQYSICYAVCLQA